MQKMETLVNFTSRRRKKMFTITHSLLALLDPVRKWRESLTIPDEIQHRLTKSHKDLIWNEFGFRL